MTTLTLRVRPAGFFSRFIAFMIDLVIISISMTTFWFLLSQVTDFFRLDEPVRQLLGAYIDVPLLSRISASIIYILFAQFYFAFFWSLVEYTPGKLILGLRVIRLNGNRISFWRALVRSFCYFLSSLLFFAGFILIIFDKKRQALHDKIAGTLVIYR